jgi:hypothetical protein
LPEKVKKENDGKNPAAAKVSMNRANRAAHADRVRRKMQDMRDLFKRTATESGPRRLACVNASSDRELPDIILFTTSQRPRCPRSI